MYPGHLTARPDTQGGAQSGVAGADASRVLTTADVLAELLDVAARVRAGRLDPVVCAPSTVPIPVEVPAPPAGPVTLARLLERQGADFVTGAYADLFGRAPDPEAFEHYRVSLMDGHMPKAEILGILRYSSEGRRRGVPVSGLRRRFLLQRAYRLPVLGRALRVAVAVLTLPRLLRDVQRLDQQNALLQERLARLEHALASPSAAADGPVH